MVRESIMKLGQESIDGSGDKHLPMELSPSKIEHALSWERK
jgi:hypothetical protein